MEYVSPFTQLLKTLLAGGFGFIGGAVYGLLRLWRMTVLPGKWRAFIADVLFFAFAGFAVFLFDLGIDGGTHRGYVLFGLIGGFAAYRLTFGRWLTAFALALAAGIRRLRRAISRAFSAVGAVIAGKAKKICKKCGKIRCFFQKNLEKRKRGSV